MRQRATVKLFQMVGAMKKATLKTLVKFRPKERSSSREGMETLNPPNPVMMFGSEKRSQPKRRTSVTQAETKQLLSDYKTSAYTLHWPLSVYY